MSKSDWRIEAQRSQLENALWIVNMIILRELKTQM